MAPRRRAAHPAGTYQPDRNTVVLDAKESVLASPLTVIALVNLHKVLHSYLIAPRLYQINILDELINARSEGDPIFLSPLSFNPLVTLISAAIYVPIYKQLYWMTVAVWIFRLLLFAFWWFATYVIARQLRHAAFPLILPGLLFVVPIAPKLPGWSTDAVFAHDQAGGTRRPEFSDPVTPAMA